MKDNSRFGEGHEDSEASVFLVHNFALCSHILNLEKCNKIIKGKKEGGRGREKEGEEYINEN